jgi:hypothetical protein
LLEDSLLQNILKTIFCNFLQMHLNGNSTTCYKINVEGFILTKIKTIIFKMLFLLFIISTKRRC